MQVLEVVRKVFLRRFVSRATPPRSVHDFFISFPERFIFIRECGSTLYVGMAQGVSLSLYIGIGAKFENTQKTGERRLRTAEYRTVLL